MLLQISTTLSCSLETAIAQVKKPQLLFYVAKPIVQFRPIDPSTLPENWTEGTYWVALKVLDIIPFGRQAIRISFPSVKTGFAIRDNGYSAVIRTWDHTITIVEAQEGCRYEDRIEVAAGLLTPFVWLFARMFYTHRQRRWRRLVRRSFNYSDA